MRTFAVFFITVLVALKGECKDKRGTDDYASVSTVKPITENSHQPTYTGLKFNSPPYVAPKAAAYSPPQQLNYVVQPSAYKFASPQQVVQQPQISAFKFASPPQPQAPQISFLPAPQQQYDVGQQNFAYAQPSLPKVAPAVQKIAYTPIQPQIQAKFPAPSPIQYSSAGEVSSFKYSSPLVTYSNLGVLSQVTGKSSPAASAPPPAPVAVTRVPVEQPQYQQEPQTSALQQFLYKPRLQIPQIPQYQPTQSVIPKVVYAQVPQASAPQYQPQPVQKIAASVPQQLIYSRPQQFVYTPAQQPEYAVAPAQTQPAHSAPQPVFVIAPQYQTQSAAYQHQ